MADRYLRATGNWNGPVWAATSGGAAGSAATPTSNDDVYIAANYTVTLTADASANSVLHSSGRINLQQHKLTLGYLFSSYGSTSRTVDLGSGTLEINNTDEFSYTSFNLDGTNLNFISGSSLVILQVCGMEGMFNTLSKTFNDVQINMGANSSSGPPLDITGFPTFRSLIIQSKNSAAHTVNFDEEASITVSKFVAIGSSTANRMKLRTSGDFRAEVRFQDGGTCYGQFVDLLEGPDSPGFLANKVDGDPFPTAYIGSNSVTDNTDWLLQDPPKISTLVDPLTTAPGSNPNWTVSGTVTQVASGHGGGGYSFDNYSGTITSTDSFDLVDSQIIIQLICTSYNIVVSGVGSGTFGGLANIDDPKSHIGAAAYVADSFVESSIRTLFDMDLGAVESLLYSSKFIKISIYSDVLAIEVTDGDSGQWQPVVSRTLSSDERYLFRSVRIMSGVDDSEGGILGSINPDLNQPPTTTLNTPDLKKFSTKTPTLEFTGVDPEGNPITYQIQIHTDDTFGESSSGGPPPVAR